MTAVARSRRPIWIDTTLLAAAFGVFVTLISLGVWQLERLDWKLNLINAVESRAFGDAVAVPAGPVTADEHAYLRVAVDGVLQHDLTKRIKAVTDLGPGHWLMTPLAASGGPVWINTGFVPTGTARDELTAPNGQITIQGLLRITEPDGTLLERNQPETGRWVSRDVEALSADAGLSGWAPYFVDADHMGPAGAWPRGGLTKVSFRNSHLSYALTWFAMAALFLAGMGYVIYDRWRGVPDAEDA